MQNKRDCQYAPKPGASRLRKIYMARLAARCCILLVCAWAVRSHPEGLSILEGWNFFRGFSAYHLLWAVWMVEMLFQLIPVRSSLALGSQKLFRFRFRPVREALNYQALRRHIIDTTQAAYRVMLLWVALLAVIYTLRALRVLDDAGLFLITVFFYVCDLICVLIWCPFRLIMRNRCCTTCRIFNWDHLMMFTPMVPVRGFYSVSLILVSAGVWLLWELCVMMYPERFWEHSNEALKCSSCTDKLCTQYCRKLRT